MRHIPYNPVVATQPTHASKRTSRTLRLGTWYLWLAAVTLLLLLLLLVQCVLCFRCRPLCHLEARQMLLLLLLLLAGRTTAAASLLHALQRHAAAATPTNTAVTSIDRGTLIAITTFQGHHVDAYVHHHCPRLHPVALHQLRAAHCHHQDVSSAADVRQLRRLQQHNMYAADTCEEEIQTAVVLHMVGEVRWVSQPQ
jgi:uncharacterized integral membrane protein